MDDKGISQQPYLTFFSEETAEYDVIVDQSSSAPNLKEATWGAIQPLLPIVGPTMGPEEMALVLEYSPMPESFLEKFKALQEQKAQQPPPPDPEMLKVQADQQMKQQELQFQQQKGQLDSQIKAQDMQMSAQMEQQKMTAQIQLEREKAAAQLQLEQEKAIQQFELEKMKLAHQIELERMKAQLQAQIARERAQVDMALSVENTQFENARADYKVETDAKRMERMVKAKKDSGK
jgi:hypothetical protein